VVGVMRGVVGMVGSWERALGRVVTQSRGQIAVGVGVVSMKYLVGGGERGSYP